jgi:hypothetical protein
MRKLLIMVIPLLAVAGCGTTRDRADAATAVALRMLQAVAGKDGTTACGLLAPRTRSELEQSESKSCDQAVLDEDLPRPGSPDGTKVYGQWAQVRLSDDTVFLAVFPGGWRVVAAGCKSRGEQPYDCMLQGS